MKPGNLLSQGAKSGGKRKMRIRYSTRRMPRCVRFYFVMCEKGYVKWKKDCLLPNV